MRTIIEEAGPFLQSPNYGTLTAEPTTLVIHNTAAQNGPGSAAWLRNPSSKASAHFVGYRDGAGCQLVELDKASWHAGKSEWPRGGETRSGVNGWSIGVELANCGLLHRNADGSFAYELGKKLHRYRGEPPVKASLQYDNGSCVEGWWEPYTEHQITWLRRLIAVLRAEGYKFDVVGHEELAMPLGRKCDPGAVFPWEHFARATTRRTCSALR